MLVLTRKTGECISVGSEIEISVLRISGNRVEIGIHAPRDLAIRRHSLSFVPETETEQQTRGGAFREEQSTVGLCLLSGAT